MPTDNRRVAAYLPKVIDEHLEKFKNDRGLKGDSPALIAILSEYFEVAQSVAHQGNSLIMDVVSRIEALEEKLVHVKSDLLSELKSELLIGLPNNLLRNDEISSTSTLSEHPILKGELASDPPYSSPTQAKKPTSSSELLDKTFSTMDLARRLNIDDSTLSRWKPGKLRAKSPEALLKETRERDPEKIGWTYLPEINRYEPEREVSSELPQILQSELPMVQATENGLDEPEF